MKLIVVVAGLCVLLAVARADVPCDPVPGSDPNKPIGTPAGINPGRVVWFHLPRATTWDGKTGNWWDDEYLDKNLVHEMLDQTIMSLTGLGSLEASWDALFKYNNEKRGRGSHGYVSGEKIVIKVNLNGDSAGYNDNIGNEVSPQFLRALLSQLQVKASVNTSDITIYDASRYIVPHFSMPEFDMKLVDNRGEYEGRTKVVPDFNEKFYFSSSAIPAQNETSLPLCVTEADYMIELDNFRAHTIAGITMSGKNWFGSIYRPDVNCTWMGAQYNAGHWCPHSLHDFVNVTTNPMGSYTPLVDLMGYPKLGGDALLYLVDGLYAGPVEDSFDEHGQWYPTPPERFLSEPFNNHWASSVFASQDQVALDSVAFDFLRNEPITPTARRGCVDNYLHEAALADDPPSKVVYNPTGQPGARLKSLGVHEHWNNEKDKQYSGNLKSGSGIELVKLPLGPAPRPSDSSSSDESIKVGVILAAVGGTAAFCLIFGFVLTLIAFAAFVSLGGLNLFKKKKASSSIDALRNNSSVQESDYLIQP